MISHIYAALTVLEVRSLTSARAHLVSPKGRLKDSGPGPLLQCARKLLAEIQGEETAISQSRRQSPRRPSIAISRQGRCRHFGTSKKVPVHDAPMTATTSLGFPVRQVADNRSCTSQPKLPCAAKHSLSLSIPAAFYPVHKHISCDSQSLAPLKGNSQSRQSRALTPACPSLKI